MVTPVLEVEGLTVGSPDLTLVRGVSFTLAPGGCLGLIGCSGSGKSLTGHAVTTLLRDPLRVTGGRVLLDGEDVYAARRARRRALRGPGLFCVFQSAAGALHPMLTIDRQLGEAADRVGAGFGAVAAAMQRVSLSRRCGALRPDALSGGMKQRVLLAMALILQPRVLVADEPTTGLDVLTEAEILSALKDTLAETGSACLFISHDLRVVRRLCRDTLVMADGRLVDRCAVSEMGAEDRPSATRAIHRAMERLAS